MDIQDIDTEYRAARGKSKVFNWELNLGHIFIVLSLFLSAAGLYAHDEARMATFETRLNYIDQQNLPPRVAAVEAQVHDIHDGMKQMTDVLVQIRNSLDTKQDKHN